MSFFSTGILHLNCLCYYKGNIITLGFQQQQQNYERINRYTIQQQTRAIFQRILVQKNTCKLHFSTLKLGMNNLSIYTNFFLFLHRNFLIFQTTTIRLFNKLEIETTTILHHYVSKVITTKTKYSFQQLKNNNYKITKEITRNNINNNISEPY